MKMGLMMMVVAAGGSIAMADSIDLRYTGVAGGSDASKVRVGSSTYFAGHMVHTIQSGQRAGESFSTFCIELEEAAKTDSATYEIVDLADAPAPGVPYGQAVSDEINAIVANAVELGWLDKRLQADTEQSDYHARMGAIQAAIWEALGGDIRLNSGRTDDELAYYYGVLMNPGTFDDSARINGLRAVVAAGQQDMLYVVPLPPAVLGGAGLLIGLGGLRVARRRS
ncbi:MAG: hypothetical protein AAGA55_10435 [Planctomycetota bacterium]